MVFYIRKQQTYLMSPIDTPDTVQYIWNRRKGMRLKKGLEKCITILFTAVFAICSFFTLFHFDIYPLGFRHSTVKTIIFCIIAFLLVKGYERLFNGKTSKKSNAIRIVIAFISAAVQTLLFLKILTPVGWDAFEVTNAAEYGMYNEYYYVRHTNNLFMQMMLSGWLKIWKPFGFLSALRKMELLNLLFVDAAILMAVLTARKLYGVKAADRVFICSVLLIGFHPTLSTIYSDTLAMPFPIGVLFFTVYAVEETKKRRQLFYLFTAGILGIVGYHIKPTVLIIYIAMGILLLLRWKKDFMQKQMLIMAAAVLLGAGIASGIISIIEHPVKTELKAHYPDVVPLGVLHYMGLGLSNLSDDPSGYGGWNEPEVIWTQQHINDPDYPREALAHILDRIRDYGIAGYPRHLLNKLIWAGSDGTFFYGLEGEFHLEGQSPQSTLRGRLQNGFYIETDFYQNWFSSWMQGVWLMVCVMSALSILRPSGSVYGSIARLSILGLFLFLLLFENRSRYLFLYLPVLLTVSASTIRIKNIHYQRQT